MRIKIERNKTISKVQAVALLNKIGNLATPAFFSVHFFTKKKKNTPRLRKMVASFKMTTGLTGKGMAYTPSEYALSPVMDVGLLAKGNPAVACRRMINHEGITQIKFSGVTYKVAG